MPFVNKVRLAVSKGLRVWLVGMALLAVPHCCRAQLSTITTLSSSANPAKFDQPITLTATVSSSGGTPTGTVTFGDTAINYGSVALVNGIATLTIPSPAAVIPNLAAGTHSVTAIYNGNASFAASVSQVLPQDIMTAKLFLALAHISQQPSRDLTAVGGDLTFAISANNQDVALSNVVITAVLSGRYSVKSVSASKGSCSSTLPVSCSISAINNGEVINILLHITPLLTRSVDVHLSANATINTVNDSATVRLKPFVH